MGELAQLERRVTRLEENADRMAEAHFLARRAEKEVAAMREVLEGHTRVLNAIREDQLALRADHASLRADHVAHRRETAAMRAEMRDEFAKVNANFAEVESKFALLHAGQERITELLTQHLTAIEKD